MIVTIHQPLFLPWLGLLERMASADLFVVLDHVQFDRANYQNRARFLLDGAPRWLTVPVVQRSQKERIVDKEIDHRPEGGRAPWGAAAYSTLRQAYREARWFRAYASELKDLLEARWPRLADLALASTELLRRAFGIRTPMIRSSELRVHGQKSDLVLDICRAVGATTFLGGMGGSRRYLDVAAFERAGIAVQWQAFCHPIYPQCGAGAQFVPGLAGIDALFNAGPSILRAPLEPVAAREAAAELRAAA